VSKYLQATELNILFLILVVKVLDSLELEAKILKQGH